MLKYIINNTYTDNTTGEKEYWYIGRKNFPVGKAEDHLYDVGYNMYLAGYKQLGRALNDAINRDRYYIVK